MGPARGRRRHQASAYVIDYGLNLLLGAVGLHQRPAGRPARTGRQPPVWAARPATWQPVAALRDTEFSVGARLRQDRIGRVGLFTTEGRAHRHRPRDRITETALAAYIEPAPSGALAAQHGLAADEIRPTSPPWAGSTTWATAAARARLPDQPPAGPPVFGPSTWPAAPSSTPTGATASQQRRPRRHQVNPPTAAPSTGAPDRPRPGRRAGVRAARPARAGTPACRCGRWRWPRSWSLSATRGITEPRGASAGTGWNGPTTSRPSTASSSTPTWPSRKPASPTRRRRRRPRAQRHPRHRVPGGSAPTGRPLVRAACACATWAPTPRRRAAPTNPRHSGRPTCAWDTARTAGSSSASTCSTCSTARPATSNTGAAHAQRALRYQLHGGIDGRLGTCSNPQPAGQPAHRVP